MTVRIAIACTTREPLERVLEFVHYHLNLGIDRIYLFFDDPADPAADAMPTSRVTVTRCDAAHWDHAVARCGQSLLENLDNPHDKPMIRKARGKLREIVGGEIESRKFSIETRQLLNATLALQLAIDEKLDWLFHIDTDELIYAKRESIQQILAALPEDVACLHVPPLEAVPVDPQGRARFCDVKWFKSLVQRGYPPSKRLHNLHRKIGTLAGCHISEEYFHGHLLGKAATRVRSGLAIGIHEPVSARNLPSRTTQRVRILHFDCITYDEWLAKWRRRHSGVGHAKMLRPVRRAESDRVAELDAKGDEAALHVLYDDLYRIPASHRRRLTWLRLLEQISLPESAFRPSPT